MTDDQMIHDYVGKVNILPSLETLFGYSHKVTKI